VAIYHLRVKPVSRAEGRSSTAASAYRAAAIVYDETTGQTFDYTRKRGVEHSEIVLPTECARRDINWARDRERLWNEAEKAENRSNSRVAREYEIALPHELDARQRIELTRGFAQQIADRHGCAIDIAIHAPHREGDERNHHAHLLATTRTVKAAGFGDKTRIEWSDGNRRKAGLGAGKEEISKIREAWADFANQKLKELALDARIDHRTLEAQGIDREPTVHLGPAVSSLERRGVRTEVGNRIREEQRRDQQLRLERAAEIGRLEKESFALRTSILDLSLDLKQALRERDHGHSMQSEPGAAAAARPAKERERTLAERLEAQVDRRAGELLAETVRKQKELEARQTLESERDKTHGRAQSHERGDEATPKDRNLDKDHDHDLER
jgi:ATP-dependent exoDNAse (exonuclease V) alpha subunit